MDGLSDSDLSAIEGRAVMFKGYQIADDIPALIASLRQERAEVARLKASQQLLLDRNEELVAEKAALRGAGSDEVRRLRSQMIDLSGRLKHIAEKSKEPRTVDAAWKAREFALRCGQNREQQEKAAAEMEDANQLLNEGAKHEHD